jgi:hypothetical protein
MTRVTIGDRRCRFSNGFAVYLAAFLGGLLQAALIFPLSVVFPHLGSDLAIGADAAQHIVGQRYFIADAWHWPLLDTTLLAGPAGTNIGLTDSIPLMALGAKLVRGVLPPGFHTIFLWLALSYTLQPVAAVYAVRSAGERRALPCLAAAAIAASMPALLARSQHAALSGHFLLLLALGLSLQIAAGRRGRVYLRTTLLLVVALLVHPYLMFMAAVTLAAAPVTLLLRGDRYAWGAGFGIGAGLAVTGAVALVLGYFGTQNPGGFGVYSMNLLSPIYPGDSWLLPGFGRSPDATGGQYEGYNYLGCGVLLLAGVAILASPRAAMTRHGGLILVALALTVLALSDRVYVGRREILDYADIPGALERLSWSGRILLLVAVVLVLALSWRAASGWYRRLMLAGAAFVLIALSTLGYLLHRQIVDAAELRNLVQQFRSSGRFFWPVGYMILVGSVVAVAALGRSWRVGALLAAAAVLQIADASTLRDGVARTMHEHRAWDSEAMQMRALLATHRSLTILPPFGCDLTPGYMGAMMQLLLLASERVIPVNTMYVARVATPPDCSDTVARSPLRDGELRVLYPAADARLVPDAAQLCRTIGELGVCTLRQDAGTLTAR